MAFRNKIATTCKTCGNPVAVGQGWTEGPPWVTKCQPCSGQVQQSLRILVTLESGKISIKPNAYLGERFSDYRAACMGTSYDGVRKANLVVPAKAGTVINHLREVGFPLDISPEAMAAVQGALVTVQTNLKDATLRMDVIDAKLKSLGKTLFAYQKTGIAWLASKVGALLADDMGLGKSIQALTALPENPAVVVVCPALAKGVWVREAASWRPELKVTVLSGKGSFRWPEAGEIVVLNPDILPGDGETKMVAPEGIHLISDECHLFKSNKSMRTKRFRMLSEGVRATLGVVWLLTGTPVLNRAQELWTILQMAGLATEAFGSFNNFRELMGGYHGPYGIEWGTPVNPAEVGRCLEKVMLRRMKTEVLPELPQKMYKTIPVELDAKTLKLCDKVLENLRSKNQSLDEVIAAIIKTKGGAGFQDLSKAREALAKAKIPALLELVETYEEAEQPVVVFSAHRAPIDAFIGRPGWAVITGDTAPEARTVIENDFQAGKLKGVAATIKAGGVAITLTRSHNAIFVDRDFTPALNSQAEDRILRIGQDNACLYTLLVAQHAIDERVEELLSEKTNVIDLSVNQANRKDHVEIALPPVVDFKALQAEAELDKAREIAAKAEAAAIAAEREAEAAKARLAAEEAKKNQAKAARRQASRERAIERGIVERDASHPDRHQARTPHEKWTEKAIRQLTADDPDGAKYENGVGFSKADVSVGHHLTEELTLGLTTKQWKLAEMVCRKYPRQVGKPTCTVHSDCQECKELADACFAAST